jgi:hypothetical protein
LKTADVSVAGTRSQVFSKNSEGIGAHGACR